MCYKREKRIFRRSVVKDVDEMVIIADQGKALLKSRGVQQWQRGTYPDRRLFLQDIEDAIGYVVEEENKVVGICAVTFTDEESYRHLIQGEWMTKDTDCYATIHRSAIAREQQGRHLSTFLFEAVEKMAKEKGAVSMRVDTHPDNLVMQGALCRAGFEKCGEFYIAEGDEAGDLRYGYEKIIKQEV